MQSRSGLRIEPNLGLPIYRQVAGQIADRIRKGIYPAGFRLPTTRELAHELNIHRNTIVRAFEELTAEGLVYSVVGSGTFVADSESAVPPSEVPQRSGLPWDALVSSAADAEPLKRFERLMRSITEGDFINLARMYPSPELMPEDLVRRCVDHVLKKHGSKALGYAQSHGLPKLRELMSRELWRAGVPARAEEIFVTTGSQQALDLAARALVNPGDVVLMEEHSYPGAINAFSAVGARILAVPCDEEGPLVTPLQSVLPVNTKALYLMPNCSNPTGRCISARRRRELVEWSCRTGVPLIEDDYGADLEESLGPAPIRAFDTDVLYLGTFSKKLIPALRVGFMIAPESLWQRLAALKQSMDLGTSLLLQHVLAEFIERGYLRSHLRKIQQVYAARKVALTQFLRQYLPDEVEWIPPERGVLFWLTLPSSVDSDELFQEAARRGVLVSPGSLHSIHPHYSAGIRLTFCAEPEDRLRDGVRLLGEAFYKVRNKRHAAVTKRMSSSMDGV